MQETQRKLSGEHFATFEVGDGTTGTVTLYREHLRAIQNAGYDLSAAHIAINVRLKWHGGGKLRIDGAYDADDTFVPVASAERVSTSMSRRERIQRVRANKAPQFTTIYSRQSEAASTDEPAHAAYPGRRGKALR